jgi:hypothetical protein
MHGLGFEVKAHDWFEMPNIPKASVPRNKIAKILGYV